MQFVGWTFLGSVPLNATELAVAKVWALLSLSGIVVLGHFCVAVRVGGVLVGSVVDTPIVVSTSCHMGCYWEKLCQVLKCLEMPQN